eukprot:377166-Rhodomonas_salina.1
MLARALARGRSDDTAETCKNRVSVFHTETRPVLRVFQQRGSMLVVPAEADVETVWQRTRELLATAFAPRHGTCPPAHHAQAHRVPRPAPPPDTMRGCTAHLGDAGPLHSRSLLVSAGAKNSPPENPCLPVQSLAHTHAQHAASQALLLLHR